MSLGHAITLHLNCLGFSDRDSRMWASTVSNLVHNNGPEYAVKRLKELHAAFKRAWATGSQVDVPSTWKSYKSRRGRKVFSNRLLRKLSGWSYLSTKTIRKLEGFLRTYHLIMVKETTDTQFRKFYESVTTPMESEGTMEEYSDLLDRVRIKTSSLLRRYRHPDLSPTPLVYETNSKAKRSPVLSDELTLSTEDQTNVLTKGIDFLLSDVDFNSLWERYVEEVSMCLVGNTSFPFQEFCDKRSIPVGKIAFIQEPGCKLRSVANPFRVVQSLSEPLKLRLAAILQTLDGCFVFDQDSGRERVRTWLSTGRVVHSFDASAFTDRFPFKLQRVVLYALLELKLVSKFDIDVMDMATKKNWLLPKGNSEEGEIRWIVGQPMGLGPSFNLATLSHYIVASCAPGFNPDDIAIVGDDIAIASDRTAQFYGKMMKLLGVTINEAKTVVSPLLGEFCGKVITSDGVIQSKKVKPFEIDSIESQIAYYGPSIFYHIPWKMYSTAVGAILPEHMGGLGRPAGLSLEEWFKFLNLKAMQRDSIVDTLKLVINELGGVPVSEKDEHQAMYETLNEISTWFGLAVPDLYTKYLSFRSDLVVSEWSGLESCPSDDVTISPSPRQLDLIRIRIHLDAAKLALSRVQAHHHCFDSLLEMQYLGFVSSGGYYVQKTPQVESVQYTKYGEQDERSNRSKYFLKPKRVFERLKQVFKR